jgi:hypothetical protein
VEAKLEAGLSAQCVYQDLLSEHGFKDCYESAKRYVRKLKAKDPARVWRIECKPGEEAQVDFSLGAPIVDEQGKRTRTWDVAEMIRCQGSADVSQTPRHPSMHMRVLRCFRWTAEVKKMRDTRKAVS